MQTSRQDDVCRRAVWALLRVGDDRSTACMHSYIAVEFIVMELELPA